MPLRHGYYMLPIFIVESFFSLMFALMRRFSRARATVAADICCYADIFAAAMPPAAYAMMLLL